MTVVRDRKIRTALRTNQIAEFVTVTAWKKINCGINRVFMVVQCLPPYGLKSQSRVYLNYRFLVPQLKLENFREFFRAKLRLLLTYFRAKWRLFIPCSRQLNKYGNRTHNFRGDFTFILFSFQICGAFLIKQLLTCACWI